MHTWSLIYAQGLVAALVGILHLAGIEYFLYWKLWWYDIVPHFFGGAFVMLIALWLHASFNIRLRWIAALLFVFVVSIAWEVWQFIVSGSFKDGYAFDVLSDIFINIFGSIVAMLVFRLCVRSRDTIRSKQ